jgi:hypothetical protein
MFILLGAADDPCLTAVAGALAARSRDARIIAHPFMAPACTAWRFDSTESETTLAIEGQRIAVDGVLAARRAILPVVPSEQWSLADLLYNQAEAEAALLGWLWGLRCPIIDPLPAWLWYRTRRPVLAWAAQLKQSGLPPLGSIISGDAQALAEFLQRHSGAAMESMAGGARQLVDASEAAEIFQTARMAPVRLTELHQGAWRACIAGPHLVWDDGTPPAASALSSRLHAFAASVELSFVEFVVTAGETPRMVDIEPRPRFELFGLKAQHAIAGALAETLMQRSGLPVCLDAPSWTSP